ncbi:unnamed protein product [Cutaneotrichosporon oleaginosum]
MKAFSAHFSKKRKRAHEAKSSVPPSDPTATPQAGPVHAPTSDGTLITPSPLRVALGYSDAQEYAYDDVEELEDEEYEEHAYAHAREHARSATPETPPLMENELEDDDEDLLARLLRREREYTRLQVYYEELHRRYADSKEQIAHLNRQVDALGARVERKERRIRLLKVLAIRR